VKAKEKQPLHLVSHYAQHKKVVNEVRAAVAIQQGLSIYVVEI
jgi:hypothetical protein